MQTDEELSLSSKSELMNFMQLK